MGNAGSVFAFLNIVGAVLGPVAGVMLAYYFVKKPEIDLDALYRIQRPIIQKTFIAV